MASRRFEPSARCRADRVWWRRKEKEGPAGPSLRSQSESLLTSGWAFGAHMRTTHRSGERASEHGGGGEGGQKDEGDEELAHWMYSLGVWGSAAASDPLALLCGGV